jgi:hypothetical protein
MEEFERSMGKSWGDYGQENFGDIQPMEALDYIFTLSVTTGLESLPENPRTNRTIQTVAIMSESDLRIWASKMATDSSAKEKPKNVNYYFERARSLQNFCIRYFGGEQKKDVIH